MRLGTITILLVAAVVATLAVELKDTVPPIKLDKNLRRALLKALADLEAESAEQYRKTDNDDDDDNDDEASNATTAFPDITKKDLDRHLETIRKATFSFAGFPGDEEIPSEDKLQNSSFVKTDIYVSSGSSNDEATITSNNEPRVHSESFQVHDAALPVDKSGALYAESAESFEDRAEARKLENSGSSASSVNDNVQSVTSETNGRFAESLVRSESSAATKGNSLAAPKPTVSSLTVQPKSNDSSVDPSTLPKEKSEESQEVKIFQAPLVAAFTVQQDERGVPKSVVPIYRQTGDGQALTLQEQLEFKQKLLEKQLVELQQQQFQQTQFLTRQREIYEQQLRQKQQLFLQEQARLKQLEEQRIYQLQQQQQYSFDRNNLLTLQPPFKTSNVHLQPSVSLEVPSVAASSLFRTNYQEQQQQQQQQQQQSFSPFPTDLRPPLIPAERFNRQETFGSVGNFGFNGSNNNKLTSNNFNYPTSFTVQTRNSPHSFSQFRQARPQTPAKQIQHLLYQSGVVNDLSSLRGSGGPEDLNIVSKVLALNVGAIPSNSLQFGTNQKVSSIVETPSSA